MARKGNGRRMGRGERMRAREAEAARRKRNRRNRAIRGVASGARRLTIGLVALVGVLALGALGLTGWEALAQSGGGGSEPQGPTIEYSYDERGMLERRVVRDENGEVVKETEFRIDYENPTGYPQVLAEVDGQTGALLKANDWGPAGLEAQVEFLPSGNTIRRVPVTDEMGTVRAEIARYADGAEETTY